MHECTLHTQANCVRRSNALLGYNELLVYSECKLLPLNSSWWMRVKEMSYNLLVCVCVCVRACVCMCVCYLCFPPTRFLAHSSP